MSPQTGRAFLAEARRHLGEDYLPKIERCLERLTDEQVWWRASERSNSVGNLLLHLEGNLRQWVVCGAGGRVDARERDREFAERRPLARGELLARLRASPRTGAPRRQIARAGSARSQSR